MDFHTWLSGLNFEFWSTGQHRIDPQTFFEKWSKGEAVMLDVRSDEERQFVKFPFAIEISIADLPKRLQELPKDKTIAVFCSLSDRANVAFAYLRLQGFENARLLKATYTELLNELLPGKVRALLLNKK